MFYEDSSKTNILLSNVKKKINIYNYNTLTNYILEYNDSSLLYIHFIKSKLHEEYNINIDNNKYIFLYNFNIIKNRYVLNNIDNIIMIEKDFFNFYNTDNNIDNINNIENIDNIDNIDNNIENTNNNINNNIENTNNNINNNINNNLENDIMLQKYFELFNKYHELVLFVFLLTNDKTIEGIIQFFNIPNNKLILNIIKNNQKEIVEMCTTYPNILDLYYNKLLSAQLSNSSNENNASTNEFSIRTVSGSINELTSILNNILYSTNTSSTNESTELINNTTTELINNTNIEILNNNIMDIIDTDIDTDIETYNITSNASNLLLIHNIHSMFPHSSIDNISNLLNLFLENTLII